MPGFSATQLNYKVQSGNTVLVLLGDQPIAFAQVATEAFDLGAEFLRGIGTAKPQEIQQLVFSPTISLDSFMLTDSGLSLLNYPANLSALLANNSFTFTVLAADGTVIFTYIGCVANTYNANVPTNSIITQTISFLSMDILGPDGTSILNGPFALQNIAALTAEGVAISSIL